MYTRIKELMIEAGILVDPDPSTPLTFQERMEANHYLYFKGKTVEDYIGVAPSESEAASEDDSEEDPDGSGSTPNDESSGSSLSEEPTVPAQPVAPTVPNTESSDEDFDGQEGAE